MQSSQLTTFSLLILYSIQCLRFSYLNITSFHLLLLNSRINSILFLSFCVIIAISLAIPAGVSIFNSGPISLQTLLGQQQPQSNTISTGQQLPQSNLTSAELQLLTEGNSFQIDNVTFTRNMASINGTQLHYVIGGKGDPVVLLHGWPQTWYEWRNVMPALARNYTVIAPDLPGLGDSTPPTSYDTKTIAAYIHQLVNQLGFKSIYLVGHDIGTLVSYPYAAEYPSEVKKLVVMESPIPPFIPPGRLPSWWNIFNQVPGIPETLVEGKEREFLTWFYQNEAYNSAAISQADIDEYVSHYSAPGGMHQGFEYYRAIPEGIMQNLNYAKTNLTMPVLALGAGYHKYEGNVTLPLNIYSMEKLAQNVTGIVVPNTGHWIPEEQPKFVVEQLTKFFKE
jgi:pimeloyl-ACP methyl ester carboxylesterase